MPKLTIHFIVGCLLGFVIAGFVQLAYERTAEKSCQCGTCYCPKATPKPAPPDADKGALLPTRV